ncbi:hypothetical protein TrCOL_g692 [Triparma columacea]|uniref:Mevalonate kinase n=1 Tax=Triparma columacea TaxID=722753 RepID=A0A9W7LDM0_9STRA|nr:hypothetical protein TrCOL_g692 [Triparma columacea]
MDTIKAVSSAPGKTILFGEHSVVYSPNVAVATALSSLRIRSVVEASQAGGDRNGGGMIEANLRDVKEGGLGCRLRCCDVLELELWADEEAEGGLVPLGEEKISQIRKLVKEKGGVGEEEDVTPLVPLVALVGGVLGKKEWLERRNVKITVHSKSLPVGSGLGSSAAFCVSLSAALLSVREGGGEGVEAVPGREELEKINTWGYHGESIIHGAPSGIDNTVSTYGGCVKMRRVLHEGGAGSTEKEIFKLEEPIEVLITNTFVPKSTKGLVAGVRRRWEGERGVYEAIFKAMSEISESFLRGGWTLEGMNENVRVAQGLLRTIGVSHPALEMVVETSRVYGVESKLTGAGGGGCAISILHKKVDEETRQKVEKAMGGLAWEGEGEGGRERRTFEVVRTEAGGRGVTVGSW